MNSISTTFSQAETFKYFTEKGEKTPVDKFFFLSITLPLVEHFFIFKALLKREYLVKSLEMK